MLLLQPGLLPPNPANRLPFFHHGLDLIEQVSGFYLVLVFKDIERLLEASLFEDIANIITQAPDH